MRARPPSRRRRGRSTAGRLAAALALLPMATRGQLYGRLLWALVRDTRVPLSRKAVLVAALGYVVLGRDLVPDAIPIVGAIDDIVAVLLAFDLFLDGVPEAVLDEHLTALGLDRRTFEADLAQVRRFVPGPIRRLARLAPRAFGSVVPAVRAVGSLGAVAIGRGVGRGLGGGAARGDARARAVAEGDGRGELPSRQRLDSESTVPMTDSADRVHPAVAPEGYSA